MPRLRHVGVEYKVCPGTACALKSFKGQQFTCPECHAGIAWDAVLAGARTVYEKIECPSCGASLLVDDVLRLVEIDKAKYEGETCPACREKHNPDYVRRITEDRIIVVDQDPPPYRREPRVRCRVCTHLMTFDDLACLTRCQRCGEDLWPKEEVATILRRAQGPLSQAAYLIRAMAEMGSCPHCGVEFRSECCPFCRMKTESSRDTCLSQRLSWVWVRGLTRSLDQMTPDQVDRLWFRSRQQDG